MYSFKIAAFCCVVLLTSCASQKSNLTSYLNEESTSMAGVARNTAPQEFGSKEDGVQAIMAETSEENLTIMPALANETAPEEKLTNSVASGTSTKKAKSIKEMKEMVKNGTITMSKSDMKVLNKLEKLSQKKESPLREDPFELTTLAKIIFGIGAAGLLIYLLGGGLFFLFLFMVGLGAFFCRWIQIIDF